LRNDQRESTEASQGQLTTHCAVKKKRKRKNRKAMKNPQDARNTNAVKARVTVTHLRKMSGKWKVDKSRTIGQHKVELRHAKD
jgi:hypothetical protein